MRFRIEGRLSEESGPAQERLETAQKRKAEESAEDPRVDSVPSAAREVTGVKRKADAPAEADQAAAANTARAEVVQAGHQPKRDHEEPQGGTHPNV